MDTARGEETARPWLNSRTTLESGKQEGAESELLPFILKGPPHMTATSRGVGGKSGKRCWWFREQVEAMLAPSG